MYTNYIILYITVNRFYQEIYCNNDLSTIFRTRFLIIIILKARFTIKHEKKARIECCWAAGFRCLREGIEKFIIAAQANEKFVLLSVEYIRKNEGFTVSRRGTVFECIWII